MKDLAREAGFTLPSDEWLFSEMLGRFEALVRADERALAVVKLEQRVKEAYQDGHTAGAKSEREACANFFDLNDTNLFWGSQAARYIREKGKNK